MQKTSLLPAVVVFALACTTVVSAGPKGTVQVQSINDGAITIDGDFSDWPLELFQQPTQQPIFPLGRDSLGNDANGDHILFELDRVGYFNTTPDCTQGPCGFTNEAPIDFGSSIYFAHDSQYLYVLGVFIDEELRGDRDTTFYGANNFLNDGFELFIDALGDSTEAADELNNPPNTNFDDDQPRVIPNLDDFQITLALNENFPSPAGPGSIGARQHMERAAQPALLGGFGEGDPWEFFEDIVVADRNGPGGIYRDTLEAIGGPDVAARSYDDLEAAGAPNPEIAANPGVTFPGYAIEAVVPFGFIPEFTPDHNMGLALFWRDVDEDDEPDAGSGNINWADWTQNTEVTSSEGLDGEPIGLFHTANWAELRFVTQLLPGDSDQNLEFNQLDLVKVQIAAKYLTGQQATWGEGDWNGAPGGSPGSPPPGDGFFNQLDIISALGPNHYLSGRYDALGSDGQEGDTQTSIGYDAGSGEVWVDAPAGTELTSIHIESAAGIFTGDVAQNLGGGFDNDADDNIFKATFGGSFGTIHFGNVALSGLSEEFMRNDLTVIGSLASGGGLGDVDLIYVPVPEPSAGVSVLLGVAGMFTLFRRAIGSKR